MQVASLVHHVALLGDLRPESHWKATAPKALVRVLLLLNHLPKDWPARNSPKSPKSDLKCNKMFLGALNSELSQTHRPARKNSQFKIGDPYAKFRAPSPHELAKFREAGFNSKLISI
ncbi:hypothetical protein ALQ34_200078 [Pseudomonas syringae pv. maculicola]|nr:hypothetical protein ALQ34_200078 [Pseudomonas syringae pv. maculicola]